MTDAAPTQQTDQLIDALLACPLAQRAEYLLRFPPATPDTAPDPRALLSAIADRAAELAIADTPRAERIARLAIELGDSMGLPSTAARARVTLGHVLNYATRFDEALAELDHAAIQGSACGDAFAVARASLVAMHGLARLGRLDDAVLAGARAISGFDAINEPVWRAKADVNLGVLKRMRDDAAGALAHFESARAVFASAPPVLAQIESNRAEALLDLARFAEAQQAFESALAAFTSAGAAHAAAIAEGNLADLLSRQGRFERALDHFERARRTMEGVGSPADLARLQSEEGDALSAIGMDDEAVESFRRAITALDAAGLTAESARARAGLARPLERLGHPDRADATIAEAIAIFDAIPNPTASARAGVERARLSLDSGSPSLALTILEPLMPALHDRPADHAWALVVRAGVLAALGRRAESEAHADQAIALASSLGMIPLVGDALFTRASVRLARGHLDDAIADLLAAIDIAERIRGSLQADRFRAASMGRRHEVYDSTVRALLERATARPATASSDRARAFETIDQSRARGLLDLVRGGVELAEQLASAATPADAALLHELASRRAEMNAHHARLFAADDRGSSISPTRRGESAKRLEELEAAVVALERRLAAVRGLHNLSHAPTSLAQVQAVLTPDEVLIEFFAVGGQLGAALVRRDSLQIVPNLATVADIAELAQRLAMTIDRAVVGAVRRGAVPRASTAEPPPVFPPDPVCTRLLGRLHASLIAPLEPHLSGVERVLISPHEAMYGVPMHALSNGSISLVQRFELVTIPSAALLRHARTNPHPRAPGLPLVVGVPDDVAPEMGEEARAVAASIGSARLIVGTEATFASFATQSADAPLIHLACHGVFASRNPMQARLRFSDAWITVRDIMALSLPGSVVVLSGCETGLAAARHGGEAYGLGRALLAAGASAVVMSLWPVHDRTTRELMEWMYQSLGRGYLSGGEPSPGSGVASCLRQAQRRLIARGEHPAMWAPFIMMGEPTP